MVKNVENQEDLSKMSVEVALSHLGVAIQALSESNGALFTRIKLLEKWLDGLDSRLLVMERSYNG